VASPSSDGRTHHDEHRRIEIPQTSASGQTSEALPHSSSPSLGRVGTARREAKSRCRAEKARGGSASATSHRRVEQLAARLGRTLEGMPMTRTSMIRHRRDGRSVSPAACREAVGPRPAPGRSGRRRTLKRNKAHGRSERHAAGNGNVSQRTRQRRNALKLSASWERRWRWLSETADIGGAITLSKHQRQEGKGRREASRLLTRGTLRRV